MTEWYMKSFWLEISQCGWTPSSSLNRFMPSKYQGPSLNPLFRCSSNHKRPKAALHLHLSIWSSAFTTQQQQSHVFWIGFPRKKIGKHGFPHVSSSRYWNCPIVPFIMLVSAMMGHIKSHDWTIPTSGMVWLISQRTMGIPTNKNGTSTTENGNQQTWKNLYCQPWIDQDRNKLC